jgi:hypothetical protein
MPREEAFVGVVFENSGEANQVPLADLIDALTRFLDHFGTKALVGETFLATIGSGDGHARLARLLEACGYADDPNGLF